MRKLKTILMAALAMTFLLNSSVECFAAEAENTYRVTVSAGNQGSINGSDKYTEILASGADFEFETGAVTLKTTTGTDAEGNEVVVPSKYFVKGFKISGREELYLRIGFTVTEDRDYVVAYGIAGNQTLYTVEYVDTNGKTLAEPDRFYGSVGDKPIVAGKYIAGYAPQAFALTGELVKNPEESSEVNNFKFVYTPSQIDYYNRVTEYVDGGYYTVFVNGGTSVVGGGTAGGGVAGGGATNVTGGGNETANPGDENAGGVPGGQEGPAEIIDLDDEETPLANIDVEGNSTENVIPMITYVAMAIAAILAAVVAVYISKKLKKKEEA